ncbi:Beta-lactamase domain-containing protein [Desulfonema magnum]|uniref:Beta-lactamase domain-containing protein n=2 Tax=Desulfonema magnum TaxID=45655 RepID=A0A975BMS0_9BACT|nr:Beta-lactamase domain-containing protein [Desulfonema magnum]
MKITDEIFQIGGGGLTSYEDAAIYLINFDGHAAIVDAGCGGSHKKLLKNIRACGVSTDAIEYLLLTHCHFDHTGGAKALKDEIHCKVISHELDAPFLEQGNPIVTAASWYGSGMTPFAVDRKLSGAQEDIKLGGRIIQAIHIPGHSPGSVAYLTESDGLRVLFGQDVHGPLDSSLLSNKEDYLRSLNLLISLEADILCEGHYGIFRGKDEVKDFIRSFLKS